MTENHFHSLPYKLEDTYILPFGNFYFYEKFVVAEIGEGVLYDAHMVNMVLELIDSHYGKRANIGYISHRIHEYTVDKTAWSFFTKRINRFSGYATVPAHKESFWNKILNVNKTQFEKATFDDLLDAASWITSLGILIKNRKIAKKYISPLKNRTHLL